MFQRFESLELIRKLGFMAAMLQLLLCDVIVPPIGRDVEDVPPPGVTDACKGAICEGMAWMLDVPTTGDRRQLHEMITTPPRTIMGTLVALLRNKNDIVVTRCGVLCVWVGWACVLTRTA